MIDKWARLLNIQKLQSIKPSGKEYHLIKLMGREAGEMQHDLQWLLMCLLRQLGTVRRRRRDILKKRALKRRWSRLGDIIQRLWRVVK